MGGRRRSSAIVRSIVLGVGAAAGLATLVATTPALAERTDADPAIVDVGSDDEAMNTAMADAIRSIDAFVALVEANPNGCFLFKVEVQTGVPGNSEFIWMQVFEFFDDRIEGVMTNNGRDIPYSFGDPYVADIAQLRDWSVHGAPCDTGPVYGNFTLRVLMARNPEMLDPAMKSRLQPLPPAAAARAARPVGNMLKQLRD